MLLVDLVAFEFGEAVFVVFSECAKLTVYLICVCEVFVFGGEVFDSLLELLYGGLVLENETSVVVLVDFEDVETCFHFIKPIFYGIEAEVDLIDDWLKEELDSLEVCVGEHVLIVD